MSVSGSATEPWVRHYREDMEITISILIGISSAAIFALLGVLIKNILIPWINTITYHGVNISGHWYTKTILPSGNVQDMTMILKQRGQNINGEIRITKHLQKTGNTEIKNFSVKGEIKDRFLIFNAKNVDKQAIGIHSELLEVIGDARTLKGCGIWYSITNKCIQSYNFEWTKGSSQYIE